MGARECIWRSTTIAAPWSEWGGSHDSPPFGHIPPYISANLRFCVGALDPDRRGLSASLSNALEVRRRSPCSRLLLSNASKDFGQILHRTPQPPQIVLISKRFGTTSVQTAMTSLRFNRDLSKMNVFPMPDGTIACTDDEHILCADHSCELMRVVNRQECALCFVVSVHASAFPFSILKTTVPPQMLNDGS